MPHYLVANTPPLKTPYFCTLLYFFGAYGPFLHYFSGPRVVFYIIAPAQPHATLVAVYPALFFTDVSFLFWP